MSINETQKHHIPSRVPSTGTAQSRQNIVEIFAGTANDCLSEFGYFPGMPQRFKELEDQNAQWRLENMKLYQDNASLLESIRQQNEHIKEIRAPDADKNTTIMQLNSELKKTRVQRDELARAQSASNSTPSQLQQDFTSLQRDYIRILTGYRSKCAEVEHLQNQVRTLTAHFSSRSQPQARIPQAQTQHHPQHQQQQQAQQQNRPQVQQHPQHQLQQQFQQQSRPQIQHQSQPLIHQLVYVQPLQANHPAQWQSAPSLLQPHVQKHVQQQHPRWSVPVISGPQQTKRQSPPQVQKQKNPLSQTQQAIFDQRCQAILLSQQHSWPRQSSGNMSDQESFANMANPQRHPPLPHGWPPSSSRPNSEPPHSSTSPMVPTMPEPFATRPRTSLSNSSGHPVVSPHSPLRQLFFSPPGSDFNPDLPIIPPSNMVSSTPIEPNTSTYVPLTVSPQDIYLIPENQVPSPQVKDVQGFETSTSGVGTSISPVASQPVNVALGLSASVPHRVNSLKRDSPIESESHHDVTEQLQKRPRLESSQLELKTNSSIEPIADGTEDTFQMDIDKDEVVEVGPDGLRLVNDCISDLFGEEGEGEGKGRYCKLCIVRRTMGYLTDSPKPFVNATNDELQEHGMTEHAEAWDTLRQNV